MCDQPSGNSFSTTGFCRLSATAPLVVHTNNNVHSIGVRAHPFVQGRFMLGEVDCNACGRNDNKIRASTFSRRGIYAHRTAHHAEQFLPDVGTTSRPLVSRPVLTMEPWPGTRQACGALPCQQTTFNSSSAAAERGAILVFVYRTLRNHFREVFCCTNVG